MVKNDLKPLWFLALMLVANTSIAQNIATQSVNPSGKRLVQNNGSLSFILGELYAFGYVDSLGNTLNSAFTVGATSVSGIQESDVNVLKVIVYPNPSSEFINIKILHSTLELLLVSIIDSKGNEVYKSKHEFISNNIGINISSFVSGSYILLLKTNGKTQGVYKIVKQ
jgi:hypothetical protein